MSKDSSKKKDLTLHYWVYDDDFNTIQIIHTQTKHTFTHTQHGRGLMEVPRMLLAVASEFPPTDYEDLRYTTDKVIEKDDPRLPFSSVASSLTKNLGRLPVISTESWTCGQSGSINVYIASTRDLMGEKGNWKEFCDVLTVQVRFFLLLLLLHSNNNDNNKNNRNPLKT